MRKSDITETKKGTGNIYVGGGVSRFYAGAKDLPLVWKIAPGWLKIGVEYAIIPIYVCRLEGDFMHYNKSPMLRFFNALFEFILLVVVFIIAGALRSVSPIGSRFFMWDVWAFLPIAGLYALVNVACYVVEGCYRSLHSQNKMRQLFQIGVTNLVGLAMMATVFYIFRVSQLSRLLLAYYYVLSVVGILAKRMLFSALAIAYVRRHDIVPRTLIIGSGELAHRFYNEVFREKKTMAMRYSGYLAAAPCADLPDYCGTVADLFEVVRTQKIEMLVLAQDVQDAEEVRRIMLLADNFHLRVEAVPVYNDFVTARSELDSIGGMRYMDLRLMNTCDIMGVNIVVTDMDKTLRLIEEKLEDWRGKYICVANVHTTVTAHEDPDYQKVQNGAVMALPDGGPLSKYSRQQGYVDAARVTGPDLMKELLKESKTKHYRHYFYGSTQKTLDVLREKVTENYPGAVIAGMYSPPFRPLTPEEDEDVVRMINEAKPDFVWVGLGAPKQERWMAVHEDRVQALMVGVGAAFDYEAGNIRRAPQWMQKHNLEWLYRLMQDPKRLFKRYFVTNTKYLWWTWRQ